MKARSAGSWLGTIGGVLAIVVPKGLCPICVAASGSVLSTLGLSFLVDNAIMRWLLAGVLLLGLLALLSSARANERWVPFGVGVIGSVGVYAGWFFESAFVLYPGMVLLAAASILNLIKPRPEPAVPAG